MYNLPMKTSRQKVLDYIQAHSVTSAKDISQALKMTQANARHHIHILLSQGLLEKAGERQQLGKGRPMQLYRLSQQALGDNLHLLLHATLLLLSEQLGEKEYETTLEKIACYIAETGTKNPTGTSFSSLPLSRRLVAAIELLNQLNYQARWEAHHNGPHILLGRCPYQKILPLHPELCRIDLYLLEQITNSQMLQIEKLSKDASGATFCSFHLQSKRA